MAGAGGRRFAAGGGGPLLGGAAVDVGVGVGGGGGGGSGFFHMEKRVVFGFGGAFPFLRFFIAVCWCVP